MRAAIASWILGMGLVLILIFWLVGYEQQEVIKIMASREIDLGIPVYAQFVVTQRLLLANEAEIIKLVLPLYLPAEIRMLRVSLWQDGKIINEWNYGKKTDGIEDVELNLDRPRGLVGNLEVKIDGGEFLHEDRDLAPKVFYESDDLAYGDGNYRIAENEKKGDVGMRLVSRVRRFNALGEESILSQIVWWGKWVLGLAMVVQLPYLMYKRKV